MYIPKNEREPGQSGHKNSHQCFGGVCFGVCTCSSKPTPPNATVSLSGDCICHPVVFRSVCHGKLLLLLFVRRLYCYESSALPRMAANTERIATVSKMRNDPISHCFRAASALSSDLWLGQHTPPIIVSMDPRKAK